MSTVPKGGRDLLASAYRRSLEVALENGRQARFLIPRNQAQALTVILEEAAEVAVGAVARVCKLARWN